MSPLFSSPWFFIGFSTKAFNENDCILSPTSVLDSKPFSGFGNYFLSDRKSQSPESANKFKHQTRVGLGLVDALDQGEAAENGFSKPENKMILFGSQLKIKIPYRTDSPALTTPVSTPDPSNSRPPDSSSTAFWPLTPRDMELSEDYTRVITHGPNPRIIHIFGDHSWSKSEDYPSR